MTASKQKIECPSCGELISIDDVLTKQIENKIRKNFEVEQKEREQAFLQKTAEIKQREEELASSEKSIKETIAKNVADQLATEKLSLMKEAKAEAEKEQATKTAWLQEQLKEKDKKLTEATNNELALLKEKAKLEQDKHDFELEKLRQLEEAKASIHEEANKKAEEQQQYVIAQLKKQLTDAIKAKDELARKLEQGSQQTQGEVLELKLEDLLKTEFPLDNIEPVPVGVKGADIIQKVTDRFRKNCGQIVWELKQTKAWNENWIQKLKDDQRAIKADIAVIVSAVLPEDIKGFGFRDGVWICDIKLIIALATALRTNLQAVAREKSMSVGKNEKMEILYGYLTGVEFKQRVEAIVEAFTSMDNSLRKERIAYEKIWTEREKQIKKVINNTVGMYGDLSGLVTLPKIKRLELENEPTEDD